jgi:hypothetical protein
VSRPSSKVIRIGRSGRSFAFPAAKRAYCATEIVWNPSRASIPTWRANSPWLTEYGSFGPAPAWMPW